MNDNGLYIKNFSSPDEVRNLPKTKIEVVNLGKKTLMRAQFDKGWRWSNCLKPTVGTDSCQAPHTQYIVSGKMMIAMDNGEQKEVKAGDVVVIEPGHDAWVVGDEPCVAVDFTAGFMFGKPA